MTRDDANTIVRRYSRHIGARTGALNEANLAGFDWPDGQLYFEYVPEDEALVCRAKVFKPTTPLNPRVMPALEAAVRGGEDTGGGALELHAPSGGIFLTRSYADASVPFEQIRDELDRLALAGEAWNRETFRKILTSAIPPR